MLLFRVIFLCCFVIPILNGCGFSPLYSTSSHQKVVNKFQDIEISNILNQRGQFLRNLLLDNIYSNGVPNIKIKYRLEIKSLQESITSLGIQKDATATRAQMRSKLTMFLIDVRSDDQKTVLQRDLRSVNSFNILSSQYATRVSKQNAREQSLKDLSDKVIRELSLYFKNPRRER